MGLIALLLSSFVAPGITSLLLLYVLVKYFQKYLSLSNEIDEEPLNEVLTPEECEKEFGKCYSFDESVVKVSCPSCVKNEVNGMFV